MALEQNGMSNELHNFSKSYNPGSSKIPPSQIPKPLSQSKNSADSRDFINKTKLTNNSQNHNGLSHGLSNLNSHNPENFRGNFVSISSTTQPKLNAQNKVSTVSLQAELEEIFKVSDKERHEFPHSKIVGSYLIGKAIGEGAFAKVRLCLHYSTGQKVAIKVVSKEKVLQDQYMTKHFRYDILVCYLEKYSLFLIFY